MATKRVVIAPTRSDVATLVADKFLVRAQKTIKRTGAFRVVLTGGSVATEVLQAIARHQKTPDLDWSRVWLCWGDERFVDSDDSERNDAQADQALLDSLNLDPTQIVRFPAANEGLDLDDAATQFRARLQQMGPAGQWPEFDLALAGMGPDGHVLSVFPGRDEALADQPDIRAVRNSPKPPAERLTMTLPLVNRSARVWLVVTGAEKAAALGLALAEVATLEVPAAGLAGRESTKVFIDQELAGLLPVELVSRELFWSAEDERSDYVPAALREP